MAAGAEGTEGSERRGQRIEPEPSRPLHGRDTGGTATPAAASRGRPVSEHGAGPLFTNVIPPIIWPMLKPCTQNVVFS